MLKNTAFHLQTKREKLCLQYAQKPCVSFLMKNAQLLDDYFREEFTKSIAGQKLSQQGNYYAIIALGGYGREEQCVHSDVDIMFLFEKKVPVQAEELIKEIIYPLWDIGLDIGHSTRTIDECKQLACQDLEILTSLLDARFICGMSPLYHRLTSGLKSKTKSAQKKFVKMLNNSCKERHNHFGDSSDLLEPDLKNGMGGLRDYHSMLWLGKIKSFISSPDNLKKNNALSKTEYDNLKTALDFIWKTRNILHIVSKRKCDRLFFEYHGRVAEQLKFKEKNEQKAVERFIGFLHAKMEIVKQHHLMFFSEKANTGNFFINKNMFKRSKINGLIVSKNMIDFASKKNPEKEPYLLLQIFLESIRLKLPLCSSAKKIIRDSKQLIEKIRYSPKAVSLFEKIMNTASDDFNVLNEMLGTGFLINFIPEFGKISNRIQYNNYHIYPVDKHSIHVLNEIRKFTTKKNLEKSTLYGELYTELTNKKILHWAALLHDIGKGNPEREHAVSGAELAKKILSGKGLSKKHIEEISFLIENHLFMINVAKRRNIEEEETAVFCARKIQSIKRLKRLYLLTIADSISTGPNAWNDWTEELLRNLFFKVLEVLNSGNFASIKKEKALEKKREKIITHALEFNFEQNYLEKIIASMSHRYLMDNSEKTIIQHLKLLETMKSGSCKFAIDIQKKQKSGSCVASICGDIVPGLFSNIAGVYTLNNFDILDARVYSWGKTNAIDIFTLQAFYDNTRENEKWKKINTDLEKVLSGELDLSKELQNKSVNRLFTKKQKIFNTAGKLEIDNESSCFFTIIEVYTYNYPGILFAVTNALYKNGVDIVYAKITTHVDQVVDIFYVRELYGGKIYSEDLIEKIKKIILTAINKFAAPYKNSINCSNVTLKG